VYHFPVELGAHGNFSFRLADMRWFFMEVTGLGDYYAVPQATQLATAGWSYQ
jgi:hypothetical protein